MKKYGFKKGNQLAFKHGECINQKPSKLYYCWSSMVTRVTNKNHVHFKYYGGRGITICEEWMNPSIFIAWAKSHGYKEDLQIDRIYNNGNYNPGNCRFVTSLINNHNRRRRKDWGLSKRGGSYQVSVTYKGITYKPGSSTDLNKALDLRDKLLKKINAHYS